MENENFLTQHNGDEYTSPFPIQMCSGEKNKHCDKFPHGSLHMVQRRLRDDQLRRVILGEKTIAHADIIPAKFGVSILTEKPVDVKLCTTCPNVFPHNWPFAGDQCIRCFERENIGNRNGFMRDDYRELIRKEVLEELKMKGDKNV